MADIDRLVGRPRKRLVGDGSFNSSERINERHIVEYELNPKQVADSAIRISQIAWLRVLEDRRLAAHRRVRETLDDPSILFDPKDIKPYERHPGYRGGRPVDYDAGDLMNNPKEIRIEPPKR